MTVLLHEGVLMLGDSMGATASLLFCEQVGELSRLRLQRISHQADLLLSCCVALVIQVEGFKRRSIPAEGVNRMHAHANNPEP